MKKLRRHVLLQLVDASSEPVMVVRINHPDWPVLFCNAACEVIAGHDVLGEPFADVVEQMVGRELALEISETIRGGQETSIAIELGSREYLLVLKPLSDEAGGPTTQYAAFWRDSASFAAGAKGDMQQALRRR